MSKKQLKEKCNANEIHRLSSHDRTKVKLLQQYTENTWVMLTTTTNAQYSNSELHTKKVTTRADYHAKSWEKEQSKEKKQGKGEINVNKSNNAYKCI